MQNQRNACWIEFIRIRQKCLLKIINMKDSKKFLYFFPMFCVCGGLAIHFSSAQYCLIESNQNKCIFYFLLIITIDCIQFSCLLMQNIKSPWVYSCELFVMLPLKSRWCRVGPPFPVLWVDSPRCGKHSSRDFGPYGHDGITQLTCGINKAFPAKHLLLTMCFLFFSRTLNPRDVWFTWSDTKSVYSAS